MVSDDLNDIFTQELGLFSIWLDCLMYGRGNNGRMWWCDEMIQRGMQVIAFPVYTPRMVGVDKNEWQC